MPLADMLPPLLRRRALTNAVRLYDNEAFNQFKVQPLFGTPRPVSSPEFILPKIEHVRKIGNWHTGPHVADPVELEKIGSESIAAFYQSASFSLTASDINTLRDFENLEGLETSMMAQDLRAQTNQHISEGMRKRALYLRRTYEYLSIQFLATTSFNLTVDGASQPYSTGLTSRNASASWATASTDIASDFNAHLKAFRQQAGRWPSLVILPPDFRDYVVDNTASGNLFVQNPEIAVGMPLGLGAKVPEERRRFSTMEIWDQYDNAGSTEDMWPEGKMVMIGDQSTLKSYTIRTLDNDFNGGLFSYTDMGTNPKSIDVIMNHNAVPAVEDVTQVLIVDLTPP